MDLFRTTYPAQAPRYGATVRVRPPRAYQAKASPMERTRYCQRCGLPQVLGTWLDVPVPCTQCGGTNYDRQPKVHALPRGYELTDADATFLRCQRIDPEDGF